MDAKLQKEKLADEIPLDFQSDARRVDVHYRSPVAVSYHRNISLTVPRHDGRILKDISLRLAREGEEDPAHFQIRVERGRVLLFGEVDSQLAKLSIANICDGVPGVISVNNQLEVRHP